MSRSLSKLPLHIDLAHRVPCEQHVDFTFLFFNVLINNELFMSVLLHDHEEGPDIFSVDAAFFFTRGEDLSSGWPTELLYFFARVVPNQLNLEATWSLIANHFVDVDTMAFRIDCEVSTFRLTLRKCVNREVVVIGLPLERLKCEHFSFDKDLLVGNSNDLGRSEVEDFNWVLFSLLRSVVINQTTVVTLWVETNPQLFWVLDHFLVDELTVRNA